MGVVGAIAFADKLLPGMPAREGERDPRWQAIIAVGEHVATHPDQVWEFVARWGVHSDEDLQAAIATCVLEHLLEHHFATVFPRVRALVASDRNFARTFSRCWKCGQAELPENSRAFDDLKAECQGK